MRSSASLVALLAGTMVVGTSIPGHAQTVSRGLLRGSMTPEAAQGLRAAPGDVSPGLLRGSMPAAGTGGLLSGGAPPPGGTVGGFRGSLPPGGQSGLVRGDLPAGMPTSAGMPPAPAGARLGDPTEADIARGIESRARLDLMKNDYGTGESKLREGVSIRERSSGLESPEVVKALENNAATLREWNRGAAADAMETQAKEIRRRQEPPPASPPPTSRLP